MSDLDLTSQSSADSAITSINNAIETVSFHRSKFGAYNNTLEHAMNNISNTSNNLTEAESRIRDTDMAKEMMIFTKNNILLQATQSMFAQSNKQPEGIIQLLK
ncbi:flagellin [Lysinibacillus parviboronicapiens]|uniref:flagellin n=1 Tax=Lysinibacillus parviboronicapiens TaxID=436516 RepID=UPI001F268E8E|nr:flagellin [Lysinibacillus parviboronicapiens]